MIEVPANIEATPEQISRAAELVAVLTAADGVIPALARDLGEALSGQVVIVSADPGIAEAAAGQWSAALAGSGIETYLTGDAAATARVHLYGHAAAHDGYSAESDDGVPLTGEVIGQGDTDVARYMTLVAVGDAVAMAVSRA